MVEKITPEEACRLIEQCAKYHESYEGGPNEATKLRAAGDLIRTQTMDGEKRARLIGTLDQVEYDYDSIEDNESEAFEEIREILKGL